MAASKPTSWLSWPSYILFHLATTGGPQLQVWAVSLSTTDLSTRRLAADLYSPVYAVWLGLVRLAPPQPIQCSTPGGNTRRSTSIDFAENQLFPGLIGLSPLTTSHPLLLQQ